MPPRIPAPGACITLEDRSFVDDHLRESESDLLYSIERKAGAPSAWLYVLLEHQSRADPWMRRGCRGSRTC